VDVPEHIGVEFLNRLELILHFFVVEEILQEFVPRQETLFIELVQFVLFGDLDLVALRRHLLLVLGVLALALRRRLQLLRVERLQVAHQVAEVVQLAHGHGAV